MIKGVEIAIIKKISKIANRIYFVVMILATILIGIPALCFISIGLILIEMFKWLLEITFMQDGDDLIW